MMFFGMLAGWMVLACAVAPMLGTALRSGGSASVEFAADHLVPAVELGAGWSGPR